MSQASSGHQENATQGRLGRDYVLTEEERRAFKECTQESFWYRCLPISVTSMALAQFLVMRGTLTASVRFGSLPKVAFAGACGYIAGKLSYMKTCQEKFKKLENSPLGEALRQRERPFSQQSGLPHSEFISGDKTASQSDNHEGALRVHGGPTRSALQSQPPTPGLADVGEEGDVWKMMPQGNYEGFHNPPTETIPPKTEVKKNKYGDTWEE